MDTRLESSLLQKP